MVQSSLSLRPIFIVPSLTKSVKAPLRQQVDPSGQDMERTASAGTIVVVFFAPTAPAKSATDIKSVENITIFGRCIISFGNNELL